MKIGETLARFQSLSIFPLRRVSLKIKAKGSASRSFSSMSIRAWILSGPTDLSGLSLSIKSFTVLSKTIKSKGFARHLVLILGIHPSGSFVSTLENWVWRIFAFSESSNLSESLSTGVAKKGGYSYLGLQLSSRVRPEEFGFHLSFRSKPFSNFLFSFRKRDFTFEVALA